MNHQTDIVKTLRTIAIGSRERGWHHDAVSQEAAADEIERLRKLLGEVRVPHPDWMTHGHGPYRTAYLPIGWVARRDAALAPKETNT